MQFRNFFASKNDMQDYMRYDITLLMVPYTLTIILLYATLTVTLLYALTVALAITLLYNLDCINLI